MKMKSKYISISNKDEDLKHGTLYEDSIGNIYRIVVTEISYSSSNWTPRGPVITSVTFNSIFHLQLDAQSSNEKTIAVAYHFNHGKSTHLKIYDGG